MREIEGGCVDVCEGGGGGGGVYGCGCGCKGIDENSDNIMLRV